MRKVVLRSRQSTSRIIEKNWKTFHVCTSFHRILKGSLGGTVQYQLLEAQGLRTLGPSARVEGQGRSLLQSIYVTGWASRGEPSRRRLRREIRNARASTACGQPPLEPLKPGAAGPDWSARDPWEPRVCRVPDPPLRVPEPGPEPRAPRRKSRVWGPVGPVWPKVW